MDFVSVIQIYTWC